jgi:hypothetical protein
VATVGALNAKGNAALRLTVHIQAGLNVGLSRVEFVETIMQMAVYASFPKALNGLFAAKEVFAMPACRITKASREFERASGQRDDARDRFGACS